MKFYLKIIVPALVLTALAFSVPSARAWPVNQDKLLQTSQNKRDAETLRKMFAKFDSVQAQCQDKQIDHTANVDGSGAKGNEKDAKGDMNYAFKHPERSVPGFLEAQKSYEKAAKQNEYCQKVYEGFVKEAEAAHLYYWNKLHEARKLSQKYALQAKVDSVNAMVAGQLAAVFGTTKVKDYLRKHPHGSVAPSKVSDAETKRAKLEKDKKELEKDTFDPIWFIRPR